MACSARGACRGGGWRAGAPREAPAGLAAALLHLGWFEAARLEYASALRRAEECLALRRELGEPAGLAEALELTAKVRGEAGDPEARGLLEESIAIWRARGDRVS